MLPSIENAFAVAVTRPCWPLSGRACATPPPHAHADSHNAAAAAARRRRQSMPASAAKRALRKDHNFRDDDGDDVDGNRPSIDQLATTAVTTASTALLRSSTQLHAIAGIVSFSFILHTSQFLFKA